MSPLYTIKACSEGGNIQEENERYCKYERKGDKEGDYVLFSEKTQD